MAIGLYKLAFAAKPEKNWIERARNLASGIGDYPCVAELAGLQHAQHPTTELLVIQGTAYLDADMPDHALGPLAAALQQSDCPETTEVLHAACVDANGSVPAAIKTLRALADTEPTRSRKAELFLTIARLVRLHSGSADAETFLKLGFQQDPGNEGAFSLLESGWIASEDWTSLGDAYRTRATFLAASGRDIEVYYRAGARLGAVASRPALGVRLLKSGLKLIFRREPEDFEPLVAMLRLAVENIVDTDGAAAAVRLLSQSLAHPRSDDEVMWIVNVGITLAADDQAMQRTKETFQALRTRLVGVAADPESLGISIDEMQGEVIGWLDPSDLVAIDEEIEDIASQAKKGGLEAANYDMIADVNVSARVELAFNGKLLDAVPRDLSLDGVYLTCTERLFLGDELKLTLLLPGEKEWSLEEHLVEGVVFLVDTDGYGIRYVNLSDQFRAGLQAAAAKNDS